MSHAGEVHKRMLRQIECGFVNLLDAEARLENADLSDPEQRGFIQESLAGARHFLIEAKKLARWLDTGECE